MDQTKPKLGNIYTSSQERKRKPHYLGSEPVIIGSFMDNPLMIPSECSTANGTFSNNMNLRGHDLPNKRADGAAGLAPSLRSLRSSRARCVAAEAILPHQMPSECTKMLKRITIKDAKFTAHSQHSILLPQNH
jgi:hypothetical protein